MYSHGTLAPVLALVGWTFIMWFWLYLTRLPAMQKARVDLKEVSRTGAKLELPVKVSRVADNYNHLHEQPTVFYALALAIQVGELSDHTFVGLSWAYVFSRVLHSLVQATQNIILLRFVIFAVGSLVLMVMLARAGWMMLG